MVSILAASPSHPRFHSQCSGYFSGEKIVDVVEVNQQRCLEESEQRLENVAPPLLELASGKVVLQK